MLGINLYYIVVTANGVFRLEVNTVQQYIQDPVKTQKEDSILMVKKGFLKQYLNLIIKTVLNKMHIRS